MLLTDSTKYGGKYWLYHTRVLDDWCLSYGTPNQNFKIFKLQISSCDTTPWKYADMHVCLKNQITAHPVH